MAAAGDGSRVVSTIEARPGALARSAAFVNAVFAPQIHVTYAVLWAAAYEAAVALAEGGTWRPSPGTAMRAATVLAMLLYLRLLDERVDEPFDRLHNPDRPLVTGLVTAAELRRAGRVVAVVVLASSALFAPWSAVVAAAFFGYAALLTPLELRFPLMRDRPLVSIAVVYPVQLLIGVYLYVSVGAPGVRPLVLLVTFAAAFLHFEFARKTVRDAAPGSRMYSATALGATGSALVALGWAVVACAALAAATPPWHGPGTSLLPYGAMVFPIAAATVFLSGRAPAWPKAQAILFLIVFYAALIVAGAVA